MRALRRFTRPATPQRCSLCAQSLPEPHEHLLDPQRQLICSCQACAILFAQGGAYRRVPRRRQRLSLPPPALGLPVNLYTLVRSAEGGAQALYPGPAGSVTQELESVPEILSGLESEVEGVLVHERVCYRIPIDEHFQLVGGLRQGEPLARLLAALEARCDA